jgi:tetratricopeptide (TPR) repeat protein
MKHVRKTGRAIWLVAALLVPHVHAMEEFPDSEEFKKGQAAYTEGKFDEAASNFEAAVKKNPQDHMSWKHLGMALLDQNEPEKAIQALDKG